MHAHLLRSRDDHIRWDRTCRVQAVQTPVSRSDRPLVEEFGFTLDEVNWLGNIVALVYLPTALGVPILVSKYSIRRCCEVAAVALLISAWVRYAGTAKSLSTQHSYALVIIGQFFAAIAQPIYQVVGPKYSETWFDLKGRTTATMIVAIANPIGGAVGQLISPLVGDTRQSILVLGILSTVVTPSIFLVGSEPPTPPTYAASKTSPPLKSLIYAMLGCLLLTGIVAAIITAPLFDRVFTHHLAITSKILVPIVGAAWLSLIWAVKPHNMGGLYAVMTIIGVCSLTMLPVGLELGCELTRNANASSAILWFSCNLLTVIFVLAEGALRAGPDADPPLNMHRALIFNGTIIMVSAASVLLLHGRQVRKERDEEKLQGIRSTQLTT
ncbi:hypothetical protein C0993_007939 [Termitomyces sp. T159_Od127]|nr:hypothetical protein C0993_007939 [Termitomyces sp. T159_Od127]